MNVINLPISIGEAMDKLTILDIKKDNIKDIRLSDIETEYNLLYEHLQQYLNQHYYYYKIMKNVNLIIWNLMDVLRKPNANLSDEEYLKICKKTIELNDLRFRIKNKINKASCSFLREQKGYDFTRIVIDINEHILNLEEITSIIHYISFFYDEIVIVSNSVCEYLFNIDNIVFVSETKYDINYSLKHKTYQDSLLETKIDLQLFNLVHSKQHNNINL